MSLETSDTDGDGLVSHDEFLTGTQAWLGTIDREGDGEITLADFDLGQDSR